MESQQADLWLYFYIIYSISTEDNHHFDLR